MDTGLSMDGIKQCRNSTLQSALKNAKIDTIIISSLERSLMTMKYLFEKELDDGSFYAQKKVQCIPIFNEIGHSSSDISLDIEHKRDPIWKWGQNIDMTYYYQLNGRYWFEHLFADKVDTFSENSQKQVEKSNISCNIHQESFKVLEQSVGEVKQDDLINLIQDHQEDESSLESNPMMVQRVDKAWRLFIKEILPQIQGTSILFIGHSCFFSYKFEKYVKNSALEKINQDEDFNMSSKTI